MHADLHARVADHHRRRVQPADARVEREVAGRTVGTDRQLEWGLEGDHERQVVRGQAVVLARRVAALLVADAATSPQRIGAGRYTTASANVDSAGDARSVMAPAYEPRAREDRPIPGSRR